MKCSFDLDMVVSSHYTHVSLSLWGTAQNKTNENGSMSKGHSQPERVLSGSNLDEKIATVLDCNPKNRTHMHDFSLI